MEGKLKSLKFHTIEPCNLKIGSLTNDSIFRYVREFNVTVEKKEDTTSLSFLDASNNLKFTVYLRNFHSIIQVNVNTYYIVMTSVPALFSQVKIYSELKWQQEDLHILNPDHDYVAELAFPFNLVYKIEFLRCCENFDKYLDYTKCQIDAKDIADVFYEDYPFANYSTVLTAINDWDTKYMILVLLTNQSMYLTDLTPELANLINSTPNSILILEEMYSNYEVFSIDLFLAYSQETLIARPKAVDENKISVRKVRMTPSALVFEPPETDVSNRVTRKFSDISEDFYMRVSFEDENNEKRIWKLCHNILEKFKRNLYEFIVLGRHYEFLGFSNSQMKNHSCWLVARESGHTADDIRSCLGDFSRCKNNSKFASRLGLCFSGTYRTLRMSRVKIPDIERNGYCFTDGVGKISTLCMDQAKERLGLSHYEVVCALQIRIGGCKGVLALDPSCTGVEVRPSMDKFDSNDNDLEVCSMSAFRHGYLNRQIILLLSGRGVKDSVFIKIQTNMLKEIDPITEDELAAVAVLSKHEREPGIAGMKYMLEKGVRIADEPYLQRMLVALYQSKVYDIKSKARILAPESLILVGVVDEYAILEYGEVFIYPSKEHSGPVLGNVVIAKNPCLHPGDIRVLEGRDVPQLRHLQDVLVFPQKGARPHSNECSGSDLDGDMYFVTWNKELIPIITEEDPMDYTAPPEMVESPSISGVIDFYVKYMESENLGNIANTHLALADKYTIYDSRVLKMAELHSMAVDYPKTGVPATIPSDHRVKEWPDYMGKPAEKSYKSEHVIGKMFRMIEDKKISEFIPLIDSRYLKVGHEQLIPIAREIYQKYAGEIKRLMRQYDAKNEFLLLTFQPGEKVGRKARSDNKIKMQDAIKDLIMNTFAEFHAFAEERNELEMLASACYWVSYSREKNKHGRLMKKFLSFPWIFHEYLL